MSPSWSWPTLTLYLTHTNTRQGRREAQMKGDLLHAHGKSPHGAHFTHWDEWGKQTGNTTICWDLELTNPCWFLLLKYDVFLQGEKNGLGIPKQPFRKQVLQWTGPRYDKDVIDSASFPGWFPISHGRGMVQRQLAPLSQEEHSSRAQVTWVTQSSSLQKRAQQCWSCTKPLRPPHEAAGE